MNKSNEEIVASCLIQDPFENANVKKLSAIKVLEALDAKDSSREELERQVAELKGENERIKEDRKIISDIRYSYKDEVSRLQTERDTLASQCGVMREALKFPTGNPFLFRHHSYCDKNKVDYDNFPDCKCRLNQYLKTLKLVTDTPFPSLETMKSREKITEAALKWYHETDGFDSQQLSDVIATHLSSLEGKS